MFKLALDAHIPIIGVQTDDVVNIEATLYALCQKTPKEISTTKNPVNWKGFLYWTEDVARVNTDTYKELVAQGSSLVVVNSSTPNSLVLDAGVLETPPSLIREFLVDLGIKEQEHIEDMLVVLRGLSLKGASETVMLTQARTGAMSLKELRRTRSMFGGTVQGLAPLDTSYDFYDFPEELTEWLNLNKDYFLMQNLPPQLRPRGLMFAGTPGLGKTMGAKAIAQYFDIPLYRLDIAATLNRYIGESEARIMRSLSLLEKEEPCVLLLDEVEKIFKSTEDTGVTQRILAQLLWWLQEHQSRVLTVMTTNDLSIIPPELYRTGRIDQVMTLHRMSPTPAKIFAGRVFQALLGQAATLPQLKIIKEAMAKIVDFSHAEVRDIVYTTVKKNKWL